MPEQQRGGRRRRWARLGVPLLVVALVGGASVRAFAASTGTDAGSYRTAAVTRESVLQQLTLTGSVRQVSQSSDSFPTGGTVTSVDVSVGDQVKAGDRLARIDPTSLETAVLRAEASLAQAEATLESDESASTSTATAQSSATASAASAQAQPAPALSAAQKAVVVAKRNVAKDMAALAAAMRVQQTSCSALGAGTPTATPPPTPTPTGSSTATGDAAATGGGTASASELASCVAALEAAAKSQQKSAADQNALGRALTALAGALTKAAAQSSASGNGEVARSSDGSGGSNSGSGPSGTSSAARIASDEAAVRTAEAALNTAKDGLSAATLRAGISGTVASVPFATGDTASSSDAIVIMGEGAVDVTVAVPLAMLPQIKVGEAARVTAAGATSAADGVVHAISLLPSADNASSTPTYPVTVRVSAPTVALGSGANATVEIELGRVNNAVTVANSAVTPVGTDGTSGVVLVWKNGIATRTTVVLGAVGLTRTQVVSGLTVGQRVVLADLTQDLPTNPNSPTRGGGGFGGAPGGAPGAGFTGRFGQVPG